ncbi:MAG: hypothetical protein AAFU56_00140 [Pseudomonadota bacterium]
MMSLYGEDSLFTLALPARIGLVALSTLLAVLILWLARRWSLGRHPVMCLAIGLGLFAAFEWVSPQIYYTYYLIIFDTLPIQMVIDWPPGPVQLFKLLTFSDNANLSFHSRGVLGWSLLLVSVLSGRTRSSRPV